MKKYNLVLKETTTAYIDCNSKLDWELASKIRNLNFLAPYPVNKEEAINIMKAAVPIGYNSFKAEILAKLPKDSQIKLAREGSVCVYVKTKHSIPKLKENERSVHNGWIRIWWD